LREVITSLPRTAPLHVAALKGHEAVMQRLIQNGATNSATNGNLSTPLHFAALHVSDRVVKLLIGNKAAIERNDRKGFTALHNAAKMGNHAAIEILLNHGAVIKNFKGPLALYLAAQFGNQDSVNVLLEGGANIEGFFGSKHFTPLICAVLEGSVIAVELRLRCGANTETKDDIGYTALDWAALQGFDTKIILLLDHCAIIEAQQSIGRNPLSLSVQYRHAPTVRLLLERGRDIDARDFWGETALDVAKRCNLRNIVHFLTGHSKRDMLDTRKRPIG